MKTLVILLSFFCFSQLSAQDYEFMYVDDSDGYTNIRESASVEASILKKVRHLQLVKVSVTETNNWRETPISVYTQEDDEWTFIEGYIHNSRLKALPIEYKEKYEKWMSSEDNVFGNISGYIAHRNCPEILIVTNYEYLMSAYEDSIFNHPFVKTQKPKLMFYADESYSVYLKEDKILESTDGMHSPIFGIFTDGLVMNRGIYEYLYYKNDEGKLLRNLYFDESKIISDAEFPVPEPELTISDIEEQAAIKARETKACLNLYPKQEKWENKDLADCINKALGWDSILIREIYYMYISGDESVKDSFWTIVNNISCDAGFCHDLDFMHEYANAYENQGEIEIEAPQLK